MREKFRHIGAALGGFAAIILPYLGLPGISTKISDRIGVTVFGGLLLLLADLKKLRKEIPKDAEQAVKID